jgi:hypothetical protein
MQPSRLMRAWRALLGCRSCSHWFFLAAAAGSIVFGFFHALALPLTVTPDGLVYLNLSDLFGTPDLPAHWHFARTPLFPLTLKVGTTVLGRQANAVVGVLSFLGIATVLVVGATTRILAGPVAGAVVILLVTWCPSFVAFQHHALSEIGTAFFFALLVLMLIWPSRNSSSHWGKVVALILILSLGYHWRSSMLVMAPISALLFFLTVWRIDREGCARRWGGCWSRLA